MGTVIGVIVGAGDVLPAGGGPPREHFLEAAINTTWFTKLLFTGAKDLAALSGVGLKEVPEEGEYLDQLTRLLLPVKEVEPNYERKLIIRNYKRLLSGLQRKASEASTPWRRQALITEIQNLNQKLQDSLENV